ncbi:TonB-dependent siderophore receptor [Steroidobacter sp.]|uniref:TonB-dependent siderophore receptor n=1 Tax=Steroidobacter sp. TaxID=1978227 RepID=UPI001A5529EA|nr:TonB-dependent siderophore receptor [Steroidobacter sp.]MBL8265639.1 TonB-dependent siderophore receptor [Steroidobacter sp.]
MALHVGAITGVAVVAMAAAFGAQGAETATRFEISALPIGDALNEFARQTGLQVVIDPQEGRGVVAREVIGSFTPSEALGKLLANTGLTFSFLNERTVSVRRDPSAKISDATTETVIVTGTTINDPILSSRTGDTLRDRPQAVTIVTRDRLDAQNLNTLTAALEQTTGVTITTTSLTQKDFYSRGFRIESIQIDGGAPLTNGLGFRQLPDLAIYEQVEVTRSPDALFSGNSAPSGSIQLIRKRPTDINQVEMALLAGRWDQFRAQLDVSGPIGFDGKLRGRTVVVSERNDLVYDVGRQSQDTVYGVLEADITDSSRVLAGFTYEDNKGPHIGFGLPRYADGGDLHLPRDTVLAPSWATEEAQTTTLFAGLDQRLGERWSLRVNATRSEQDRIDSNMYAYGAVDRTTGLIPAMYSSETHLNPVQTLADITLKGNFDLFGRTHRVAVGYDWQEVKSGGVAWFYPMASNVSAFNFDPSSIARPTRTPSPDMFIDWNQKQSGVYASLKLSVSDPLDIVMGARRSNYKTNYNEGDYVSRSSYYLYDYSDRNVVTPYAGFTYDLSRDWVVYGSFSESYQSQSGNLQGPITDARPLDPKTGNGFEVGVKGGLLEGRAATQVAVYQITQENAAVLDGRYPPSSVQSTGANCCYLGNGEVQSRGVDMEINGSLLRNWDLFVGYTINSNEFKAGYANNGAAYMAQTPKHLFKLWTTLTLPGALDAWKLSAGLTAQSRSYFAGSVAASNGSGGTVFVPYKFEQGGYTLVNARAEYQINTAWSAAFNINNVTDKTYYQSVGSASMSNWYGEPRNFILSVRFKH